MKKSSLWSLSRRLLAVLTVLSLLLSNAELTIAAGEPIVDETNNTEPTEELDQSDPDDETDPDDTDGDNGSGDNGGDNGDAGDNNNGQGGDNQGGDGNNDLIPIGDGTAVDENGNPIDETDPQNGMSLFGARNANTTTEDDDDSDPVSKSIIISSNINNNEDRSGFRFNVQSYDTEDCSVDNKTYTFEVGEDNDSANIVFSYSVNEFFALTNVNVEGADFEFKEDEHLIACTFSNIEEGEHTFAITGDVVKTDTAAPAISDIVVADGTATYESAEGVSAFSMDRAELSVTAVVADDMSGVEKVYVVDADGYEHEMALTNSETNTYTWKPESHGNYKVVKVVAVDRVGNESALDAESKILCYYTNDQIPEVTISDDEWYSVTANNRNLSININGTSLRKIEKISITDFAEDVVAESTLQNGVYCIDQTIELPNVPGEKEYAVAIKFYGDEEVRNIGSVVAKIDNKAPEGEIILTADESVSQRSGVWDYLSPYLPFISNKDITVLIKVPKTIDNDTETEKVSGLYSITYTDNGKQFTKTIDEIDRKYTDDEYNVFSYVVKANSEEEVMSEIYVTQIADAAGNTAVRNDSGLFVADGAGPRVSYTTTGSSLVEGDRLFFSEEINGTVTVTDADLDVDSVDFVEHHDTKYKRLVPVLRPKDNTTPNNSLVYDFSTSEDGEYMITTYAKDNGGKETPNGGIKSQIMVLDNQAPEIEISYDRSEPSEGGDTYYNSNVGVTVTVKERWIDRTRSVVTIKKVDQFGAETVVGPLSDWSGEFGDEEHKISFSTDGDGVYKVFVEAYDIAGNHTSKEGSNFTVDSAAPKVEISFDNTEAVNGKYYNQTRTATVTVTDFTFNPETAGLKVEEKFGTAEMGDWNQSNGFTYTCTVTFSKDGWYEISCQSEDKAHNKSDKVSEPEFVIDKTAPEINVTYNPIEASNGNFYKDTRVASVNIKEISFDEKLVEITAQPINDGGVLPAVGGFSSSDDANIAHITFDQDGTYGYVVNCTDLAGNTATNYISDVFIIDKTIPTVTFSGVEDHSANNAEVAPTVVYGDKYIDIERSNVQLRGANNGIITVGSSITPTEDGFTVNYSDFAHDKSMDDLYFLEATVYDKAGNESKETLTFSVNRHGSVFIVGDGTKALNEKYYTNEPTDISITEINIDTLTKKNVSVSRDGGIKELQAGKDYSVSQQGDDTSWKTYTYVVPKDNFELDGLYSVTVYTQDRASNVQDNKTRDAEVSFAVDRSAPSIVAAGIQEDTLYKETSHTFNVDVNDNMGVSSLVIYKDGEVIDSYDEERFDNTKDISVTLQESEKKQTITIIAEDVAGNREINVYAGVLVTTKEIDDGNTPGNSGGTPDDKASVFTAQAIMFAVIAMGAIVAISGASVLLYRRKVK